MKINAITPTSANTLTNIPTKIRSSSLLQNHWFNRRSIQETEISFQSGSFQHEKVSGKVGVVVTSSRQSHRRFVRAYLTCFNVHIDVSTHIRSFPFPEVTKWHCCASKISSCLFCSLGNDENREASSFRKLEKATDEHYNETMIGAAVERVPRVSVKESPLYRLLYFRNRRKLSLFRFSVLLLNVYRNKGIFHFLTHECFVSMIYLSVFFRLLSSFIF